MIKPGGSLAGLATAKVLQDLADVRKEKFGVIGLAFPVDEQRYCAGGWIL